MESAVSDDTIGLWQMQSQAADVSPASQESSPMHTSTHIAIVIAQTATKTSFTPLKN